MSHLDFTDLMKSSLFRNMFVGCNSLTVYLSDRKLIDRFWNLRSQRNKKINFVLKDYL